MTFALAVPIRLNTPDLFYRIQAKGNDGAAIDITGATLQLVFRSPDPAVADIVEAAVVSTKVGQTDPLLGWIEFKDGTPGTKTNFEGDWTYWPRITIGADGPFPGSTVLRYCVAAEGDDT